MTPGEHKLKGSGDAQFRRFLAHFHLLTTSFVLSFKNGRTRPSDTKKVQENTMKAETRTQSGKPARGASREEMLVVATQVFASRGFRNTDVQEIADRLGIGKATIYRAFGTKEQLFLAAVDRGMQGLNETMLSIDFNDNMEPAEKIRMALLCFLSYFDQNEELIELLIQERCEFRDREMNSYTRNWLVNSPRWKKGCLEGIEKGRLRELPVEGVVNMFSSVCYGAIFTHYFRKQKIDLQSTAALMADVMAYGLISDQSREEHPAGSARRKIKD
jgi:AcrR family transcriptional regulator